MKQAPLCEECGRPMKDGTVTNIRTGEKTERYFCLLHTKGSILVADVPDGDLDAARECNGCDHALDWNGYKFICRTFNCEYKEKWGEW